MDLTLVKTLWVFMLCIGARYL